VEPRCRNLTHTLASAIGSDGRLFVGRLPGKEGVAEPQAKHAVAENGSFYLGQASQNKVPCIVEQCSTTSFALCSLCNPASNLAMFVMAKLLSQA
jgi:hypothetical protein